MKKYKVLIICGGGYFGLVPITFLSYLDPSFDIQKAVNCVQGTSIGLNHYSRVDVGV